VSKQQVVARAVGAWKREKEGGREECVSILVFVSIELHGLRVSEQEVVACAMGACKSPREGGREGGTKG